MGRLDVRRFVWNANRWFLVQPAVAWVVTVGGAVLVVVLLLLVGSARQYAGVKAQWESLAALLVEVGEPSPGDDLPEFPSYAERFEVNAKALSALHIEESLPGKISFGYEANPEAGLVRQTATLNVASRWQEVGGLLDRAQAAIPTGYISRLQISRDSDQEWELGAEVQFTVVFREAIHGDEE